MYPSKISGADATAGEETEAVPIPLQNASTKRQSGLEDTTPGPLKVTDKVEVARFNT